MVGPCMSLTTAMAPTTPAIASCNSNSDCQYSQGNEQGKCGPASMRSVSVDTQSLWRMFDCARGQRRALASVDLGCETNHGTYDMRFPSFAIAHTFFENCQGVYEMLNAWKFCQASAPKLGGKEHTGGDVHGVYNEDS